MSKIRPLFLPPPYQDAVDHGRLILRDGTTASLRVATPEDHDALIDFFKRLSPESKLKRFFSPAKPGEDVIDALCDSSNPEDRMTLIVTRILDNTTSIVATASYLRTEDHTAEFAVAVADEFQGKGIAPMLLERLTVLAATHGFVDFIAVTHSNNHAMLDVFRHSGFQIREEKENGYIALDLSVRPGKESVARSEIRDRIFTAASIRRFFKPNGVALVGASRNPTSIGHRILDALLKAGYSGALYPINPNAESIASLPCYPSVPAIPEPVDLAVVAVPPDTVLDVVDDCAKRGIRALIVITAGFSEMGKEGKALQQALVEKVRGHGMRLVGPNCLGLINTDPGIRLNASFSPVYPPEGRIAMYSQSGALGLAILALAKRMELGLSNFVSVGNKADVSGNDLIQYWEDDPQTDAILIYLEAFNNPRRFVRIARRVARKKPIVCVKGGRTKAGRRAAGSHTAAMAGSEVPVEALFRQTGVIRCATLEEMFDLASALAHQPLPAGHRVAVVTNAGGPGILCADSCEAGGLNLPELPQSTQDELAGFLPAAASLTNPVDMIASAPPDHFRKCMYHVLRSDPVDAVIVIYIPVGVADDQEILRAISDGVDQARAEGFQDKPVLACPMIELEEVPPLQAKRERIPTYKFPESPAVVMSRIAQYARWCRSDLGHLIDFDDVDIQRGRTICSEAIDARGPGWLTGQETRDLLEAFALPLPPGGIATSANEASELARKAGFPVAVKLSSHQIVHKSEAGGVHLNLKDRLAVRRAYDAIKERLEAEGKRDAMEGVLVQPMIEGGVEVMVGVTSDPLFGPLIAFGLGGVHVEILQDVCFRITPLTDQDVEHMVKSIRGYRLLQGYRGHPPADLDAIKETLLRISLMVEMIPEINELDLNPIFAMEPGQGCRIVDARVRVVRERRKSSAPPQKWRDRS